MARLTLPGLGQIQANFGKSAFIPSGVICDGSSIFILIVLDVHRNNRIWEWFSTRSDSSCLWSFIAMFAPEKNVGNSRLRIDLPSKAAGPPQYIVPYRSLQDQLKGDTTEPLPRVKLVLVPKEPAVARAFAPL
jgi:hypothetical protein